MELIDMVLEPIFHQTNLIIFGLVETQKILKLGC